MEERGFIHSFCWATFFFRHRGSSSSACQKCVTGTDSWQGQGCCSPRLHGWQCVDILTFYCDCEGRRGKMKTYNANIKYDNLGESWFVFIRHRLKGSLMDCACSHGKTIKDTYYSPAWVGLCRNFWWKPTRTEKRKFRPCDPNSAKIFPSIRNPTRTRYTPTRTWL